MTRRWASAARETFERYLTVDPRAAGIFRIAVATLLCLDCLRHSNEAALLYSNDGVLSNHFHLFQPISPTLFSFFHAFSTLEEVEVLFALGFFCHLMLLVGYRSRLFAVLSFVFVTSRDSRMLFVENGGYVVENLTVLWACFAPIGARFSIDAWRASWRKRKELTRAELGETASGSDRVTPVRSLVGLASTVNLAIVYFFNVINKTGVIWRQGNTVHYVLHINRMVTGLAVIVREHVPLLVLKIADFGVLVTEATICVMILSPNGRRLTRLVAIGLMLGLHTALGFFMRLGPFSWFLIAWSSLLLLPIHFDRLGRIEARRARTCEIGLSTKDPFSLAIGRIVARLDHAGRVRFVSPPKGKLLAVRAGDEGAFTTEPRAMISTVASALPFGRYFHRALQIASVGLFDRTIAAILARRESITRIFGLTTTPEPDRSVSSPLETKYERIKVAGRELVLAYFMLCATMQVWIENKVIPPTLPPPLKPGQKLDADERRAYEFLKRHFGDDPIRLKPERAPEFQALTIAYTRTNQGWGMFAPNPIRDDGVLAIDALTIEGRHVDPLTGIAPDLDLTDSRGEGLSQLRQDYGNRIRLDRNERYREQLRDYVLRYPEQTKNARDEIISVDVYWVRAYCPDPGETRATHNELVPILSWRKAGYVRNPGGPALPPKLRTRSAEKDRNALED